MSNKIDNRPFCCKHFEHDYKTYNNHPNVRVVRLVSEEFISYDKEIKLPFRFPPYPIELWPKNRMTLFVMTTGYRLFEFGNCSRKDNTLYKRIFYCPYCGKSLVGCLGEAVHPSWPPRGQACGTCFCSLPTWEAHPSQETSLPWSPMVSHGLP